MHQLPLSACSVLWVKPSPTPAPAAPVSLQRGVGQPQPLTPAPAAPVSLQRDVGQAQPPATLQQERQRRARANRILDNHRDMIMVVTDEECWEDEDGTLSNRLYVRRTCILEDAMQAAVRRSFREKLRCPLRVQFFDEAGVDMGGPRRELLRIVLEQVQEDISSAITTGGTADSESCERFYKYGMFCGIAMVQARICEPCILQAVKASADAAWARSFRDGMDMLEACKVIQENPVCEVLFSSAKLTAVGLTSLLIATFEGIEGSSRRVAEENAMAHFVSFLHDLEEEKWLPQTLERMLAFITGATRVPAGGFGLQIPVKFGTEGQIPTSRTCDNLLEIVIPCCRDKNVMAQKWLIALANIEAGFMLA